MIEKLIVFFSPDVWKGALLGAIVSATFSGALWLLAFIYIRTRKLLPIRRLLGAIAAKDDICLVFTNEMFSADHRYSSRDPDYFPPKPQEQQHWVNVPYVVSTSDMQATGDVLNLLGRTGKSSGIEFCSISKDWDRWSNNMICIGGNFKTWKVFETCEPKFVSLAPAGNTVEFKFCDSEKRYGAINKNDYGLIFKTTIPSTRKKCLIVMGMGAIGTEAAAYFLRSQGEAIGKMYGGQDFAFLVHARLDQGKQSARPERSYPQPSKMRRLMHPFLWFRTFKRIVETPIKTVEQTIGGDSLTGADAGLRASQP